MRHGKHLAGAGIAIAGLLILTQPFGLELRLRSNDAAARLGGEEFWTEGPSGQALGRPDSVADLAEAHNLEDILALEEAIQRLESRDPGMAEVVRLRFYVGLGVNETAKCLGVSRTTVNRDWSVARAWLYHEIR